MSSSPEPHHHQQQQEQEEQQRDLIELPITISSSPPTLDLLVLEEKAEALRTDLLLSLEGMYRASACHGTITCTLKEEGCISKK